MGLFNLIFGRSRTTAPTGDVLFTNREQIRQTLYKIKSLDQGQREMIFKEICQELDEGKVTRYEGEYKLKPIFYRMYKEGKISSTDYNNLKKILK